MVLRFAHSFVEVTEQSFELCHGFAFLDSEQHLTFVVVDQVPKVESESVDWIKFAFKILQFLPQALNSFEFFSSIEWVFEPLGEGICN